MTEKSSGFIANDNGSSLEEFIENTLARKGYFKVQRNKFLAVQCLKQPVYAKQFLVGKSIYQTGLFYDFILYHPAKHPLCYDS